MAKPVNDNIDPTPRVLSLVAGLIEDGFDPMQIAAGLATTSCSLILDEGGNGESCHKTVDLALGHIARRDGILN